MTDTETCRFYHLHQDTGLCIHYIPDATGPGFCKRDREFLCILDKQICEGRYTDDR